MQILHIIDILQLFVQYNLFCLNQILKNYQDLDIDPNEPHDIILRKFAQFANIKIENVVVCTLDRPRHSELITSIRSTGARIKLIPDGDVSAVIATSIEGSGIDMYMGIGGSPEGVLGAAALRCLGGKIYSKLVFNNDEGFLVCNKYINNEFKKKYELIDNEDLIRFIKVQVESFIYDQ